MLAKFPAWKQGFAAKHGIVGMITPGRGISLKGCGSAVKNEFELGYQDALHQFQRMLTRREKSLQEEVKTVSEGDECILKGKILEIQHIIEIVDSLRR